MKTFKFNSLFLTTLMLVIGLLLLAAPADSTTYVVDMDANQIALILN